MIKINALRDFVSPYYKNKDTMHNMWHIELVIRYVDMIIDQGRYHLRYDKLIIAAYFHGLINSFQPQIREWLAVNCIKASDIDHIVTIALESQRSSKPKTVEGMVLHDAHIIEGGRLYSLTKCLVTGAARGQTLVETIHYIEENLIDKNQCFLPETIPLGQQANQYMKSFIKELKEGIFLP